jgi:hypothetical protein
LNCQFPEHEIPSGMASRICDLREERLRGCVK